jgi:hypothetical protein
MTFSLDSLFEQVNDERVKDLCFSMVKISSPTGDSRQMMLLFLFEKARYLPCVTVQREKEFMATRKAWKWQNLSELRKCILALPSTILV